MPKNNKQSGQKMASLAGETMADPNASGVQKSLAGSVLSQFHSGNQTGADMEEVASKVLTSSKYNGKTKALAGSVLSQANKAR